MSPATLSALLFVGFALATSAGLLLVKAWIPEAHQAWQDGHRYARPLLLVAAGAGLYIASFGIWMVIVARMSLTVAYPIAIGAALVLLTLGARVFLGESITPMKIFGALLVFAGIVALTR